jgi:hypothetical protein
MPDAEAVVGKSLGEVTGLPFRARDVAALDVQRRRAGQIDRDVGTMLPRHGALL